MLPGARDVSSFFFFVLSRTFRAEIRSLKKITTGMDLEVERVCAGMVGEEEKVSGSEVLVDLKLLRGLKHHY